VDQVGAGDVAARVILLAPLDRADRMVAALRAGVVAASISRRGSAVRVQVDPPELT
jgi:hypothetical protein